MSMLNVKRPQMVGTFFRKSLLDLVKGLRSHKDDESAFINECLSEIKEEVKNSDYDIKAAAVLKLAYLYMIGYDISFSHFHIVEVMSQPSFNHRRIAYLAAALSFTEDTDVILLTTHHFKKSCKNQHSSDIRMAEGFIYESGQATNCLANICTPALAETLLEDVYGMMNSSKPYVRKKAVLVLYSIFKKFPRALPLSFNRLKEKLNDEDPGVQNAAVNVICELARKNPKNYLGLLPQLCELLNNSNNNWMLIKLVKLLGSLIPAEPRLGRKLHEPLTHIITNTPAKSLLYECINTATNCQQMSKSMIRLCLDKLRTFVEDPDQNLKYLGLLGLNKIMRHNIKAVAQHRELILQCLDDPDQTIRMRALDLITSMVNEKNLQAIIRRLTDHLYGTDGNYREHVLEQMITVCAKDDYGFVLDFAWYVELLTNMTGLSSMGKRNAELIATQLKDVTIRVPEVREFSVEQMEGIIVNNGLIGDAHNMASNSICRILLAAAYIVGEFSKFVQQHLILVCAMLQARIASLEGDIQCVFIHNALKVVCAGLQKYLEDCENGDDASDDENENENNSDDEQNGEAAENENNEKPPRTEQERRIRAFKKCSDLVDGSIRLLEPLSHSCFIEVQERATSYLYFLKWMQGIFSMGRDPKDENDEKKENDAATQQNGTDLMEVMGAASNNSNNNNNDIFAGIVEMNSQRWNETLDIIDSFAQVFGNELIPVHVDAQAAMAAKIPKGLDLDRWIGEEWPDSSSEGDSESERDESGENNDPWWPEYSDKPRDVSQKERQIAANQKQQRLQRNEHDPNYLGPRSEETQNAQNAQNEDDNEEENGRKGRKKGKLTDKEIEEAAITVGKERLGLTVGPSKAKKRSKRKQVKYNVSKKIETFGGVSKKSKESNVTTGEPKDSLEKDYNFNEPIKEQMPHLEPYKQEVGRLQTPGTTKENSEELNEQKEKKGKKKKGKKDKKEKKNQKGKKNKKGKKGNDLLDDMKQLSDFEPNDKKEQKERKKDKKGKKKKNKESSEKAEQVEETADDLFGMLGFDTSNGTANGNDAPKASKKKSKERKASKQASNDAGDDFLSGLFGNHEPTENGAVKADEDADKADKTDNADTANKDAEDDNSEDEEKTSKPKKKKSKKRKNGVMSGDLPPSSIHVLHSDDNVSITYNVRPDKKKASLKVTFITKNTSDKDIAGVKLEVSKSDSIKLAKKDGSSSKKLELCSNLESNDENSESFTFKCKDYSANELLSCQLSYSFENKPKKVKKVEDIELKFGTWAFVMSSSDSFESEEKLSEFTENNLTPEAKKKITLPANRSIAEALDTLVKVWRVEIVGSSGKKASYYGKLLLDRHVAMFVKTSSKKNMLQIVAHGSDKEFVDAMLEEVEEILLS